MKYILGIICATIVALPGISSAYEVTGASATKLSENTVLFTIEYQLGFAKYGVQAPIGAVHDGEMDSPYLNYTLAQEGSDEVSVKSAAALVLSKASVGDNQYQVDAGEAQQFVLFALVSFADVAQMDGLQLQVTSLPFALLDDEVVSQNGLSAGELQSYVTPQVK